MARVRTVEFLPEIFQTPVNRQFLNATLDQLVQEPAFTKTQGYVGRKIGPGVNPVDRYVIEPTKNRNDYQLEPGVISLEPDTNNIVDAITYPGINDALALQGANVSNPDSLYSSQYYSWDPFVDFDKFVNYSQYYWLPAGPLAVDVSATSIPLTDNFVVTRENGVYTFSGLNGSNPIVTLLRGGNYTFEVAQNAKEDVNFRVQNDANNAYLIDYQPNPNLKLVRGNTYIFNLLLDGPFPFYIKTEPTLGTTNLYNDGVTGNGNASGKIIFTVPQNAPNTLYYLNASQVNMRGTIEVVDAVPGTGPGFWIQTDPGVNGRIPATPNISSRDVFGVINNGEDLGTVTFNVPESTAQDFYYTLDKIGNISGKPAGTVDLITTLKFNEINNVFLGPFLEANPDGIDGVKNLEGKTLVFLNQTIDVEAGGWEITTQFDPLQPGSENNGLPGSYDTLSFDQSTPIISQSARYSVWQIQYNTTNDGQVYMTLNNVLEVNNLQEFSALFGQKYASTQWYKNSSGYFEQIPLLTAVRNLLYYQDGTDPEIFGQIRLLEQSQSETIFIEDILGKPNYTSPNGVIFTNGLKVVFRGDVEPASFRNNEYYVEGVGTAIKLLPVTNFITPETYTQSQSVPYDSTPYDVGNYDATLNAPEIPDYITVNRASPDLNAWTRSNRWFHIDVINVSAAYNNTTAVVDNLFRAKRPILEFRAGTRLFEFGTQGKQPVDIVDFQATDALSNINGTTGYSVDGYSFMNGTRVIFANDSDLKVRNKIYEVEFIVPDTVPPLIAQPVINLVPADDATVLVNQTVVCLSGSTQQGLSFYFDGLDWLPAQLKTKVNQPPLFDVYDADGISFADRAKYPSSNFTGCKLFSYATGSTVPDPVLGFPLRYLSLANVGDIVFDNNLYTDTFDYVSNAVGQVLNVSNGFVRQYQDRVSFTREIGWQPAVTRSIVRQQFQFSYDGSPLLLDVAAVPNAAVPPIQLYVNSKFQDPSNYTYTVTTDTTTINLTTAYVPGDIIEVAVISNQISQTGFFQVPINLENNPLNANSPRFTLGTVRSHYETIGENLLNIQGPIIGANNTRDLGNLVPYGLQIVQQSSPLTLAGYFMRNKEYDIFSAIEYNSREYIKFKNLLLETVIRNEYGNMTVSEILDSALAEFTAGRTDINPFYWSDMLPAGSVYTETVETITPITTPVFNTIQTYDFTSANYLGLLVYLNNELLIKGKDYVVSADSPTLTITVSLNIGDTVSIREYQNTAGNFCPNTPTKLGLYPKYLPSIFLDTNYVNPTLVIQGHDGSITVAFGDIRDEILLEFEKRIYDNLKTDGNPIPLTFDDISPGFFRTTDYSQTDINNILGESFLIWVGWNKLDYKKQNYIANNPFTYNYSSAGNKLDNQPLLGAWRGIYRYFYDTESPNTTPWQMLGFSEQPAWWETRYGPAPYTSDNLVLWDDLELGLVADPIEPYILSQYARPGLSKIIPNGTEGQLLDPLQSVVGAYDPNAFRKSWAVGDGGPVEYSWWTSSSYPFAVMRLLALTRPAEFFCLFADRDLYRYSAEFDQYLYNGRYRLDANGVQVYGNGVSKASYINWIVDYNQQLGRNSTSVLTRDLANLDVRLCYRMASFTDKQYLKIFVERSSPDSINSSLLLPDDSYNLLLYKNQPFAKITYSSLIIEKVADGYSVYGYNNATPYFNILASSSNGLLQTISAAGAAVRVPAQYTNNVVQVPYGYVFTNTTMMVDFILSYGAYLQSQGLIFDDRENGYTLNWNQMATEFLYFSQQGWDTGTIININPSANTLKAFREGAVVDTIESTSPENLVLDQNLITLPTKDLIVNREGNDFSVTSPTQQAISFLNMRFTSFENMIVLDNVSIFNDLIYDPTTGSRQNRIRISATTSTGWNGTVDAQGFILNQNNVKEWLPNRKYTKGEIVLYKNTYWSAQTIVQPKLEFDYNDWVKSDYSAIQKGLLPNIANKANQLANTYNTQVANLEADNDLFSYGLIGFRQRQYMADLNLDDVSQVNIYKQFLGTKGTLRAAELFTAADLGKESGEYDIYENWGILASTYGANANRSFFELRLNEADLKSDPCTVQVVLPQQPSQANQTILLEDVWRESYKLTSTDILPTTYVSNKDSALPTAGYVNIDDVDITVFSLDDPASIDANLERIGVGTTIWAAKSNSYDWNVYRCGRVPGQLNQITNNLDSTSLLQFSTGHGLLAGQLIIIRYFNDQVNGVYRILSVPSITTAVVAIDFSNTDQTSISGTGLVFYLQTMRVAQASDVASLPYANSLIPGARAYVDKNVNGHWQVLEKQNPFSSYSEISAKTPVENSRYGSSIAQTENLFCALIGAPSVGANVGAVYVYNQNSDDDFFETLKLTLNAANVIGYGNQVAFGKNNWAAASASASYFDAGYVTPLYRSPVDGGIIQTQLLMSPDQNFGPSQFGTSIAVSQDERWMYVSSPNTDNGGRVHAYARVDVEFQSVSYRTDGSTFIYNWNDYLVIDPAQPDQLIVTLNDAVLQEGTDYTVNIDNVALTAIPLADSLLKITRRQAVQLDNKTYFGISQDTTTGSGAGATFTIVNTRGVYTPTITNGGSGYVLGEQLTIYGTQIQTGGTSPANDLTITVTSVEGGSITGISYTGSGIGNTSAFALGEYLYTATNIYSFTVIVDGQYQRPHIDYEFNNDSNASTQDLLFLNNPAPGASITVTSNTYWQYCDTISLPGLLANARFGSSVSTTTDARQVFIGAENDRSSIVDSNGNTVFVEAGSVYAFDRSVVRTLIQDADTTTYSIPSTVYNPLTVILNGQFLNVRNQTAGGITTTQFINGQVDVDFDTSQITLLVDLTVGDVLEIENNQFQKIQKITAENLFDSAKFGASNDICSTNCSLYIGAPLDGSVLPQAGSVQRNVNQSRVYGVITSGTANPGLTAGDTIRINNTVVAVPAIPDNTVNGLVDAINSANIPNVLAAQTPDAEFIGDGVTKIFNIGETYASAQSYTTVVYIDNILQTAGVSYTYNANTKDIAFVVAPAPLSVVKVVSGRLTLSVKNLEAAESGNKLTVLPGLTGTAFDNLGFETFVYTQTITSPNPTDFAYFGTSLEINTSAINLVVGAPNGDTYEPVTFDGGETYFDDRSTTFFTPEFNSGVVYTFDYLNSNNGSINNPGKFVFGQQIYNTKLKPNDEFGIAVNFVGGRLMVGAPGNDADDSSLNYGFVSVYNNPNREPAWKIIHQQQPVVDVDLINSVFMYDKLTSSTQTYFDFFDPLQGKILGAAQRNLDYIGAVDPANYNVGTVHNQGNSWGPEHVGEMWWDTDTVRFIDPNQDDIVYASRRWGQVFPGSRVDVYQWTASSVPPVNYTGPGIPLSLTSFTVRSNLSKENVFVTTYYFWVRDITTINSSAGKTLSAVGVARYIENPRTSGIPYVAAINSSTIAIYNGLQYISAADTILHVAFDRVLNDSNIHTEFQLIAAGRPDSFLNPVLYRKLQDSFCGVDTRGGTVPDPLLSPAERYGVQFRPRQSMFVDRFLALQNYLTRANTVLKQYPIVETRKLSLLNSAEPEPSSIALVDGVTVTVWNQRVANIEELSYQNLSTVPLGYLYLVESDSTQNGFWTIYVVASSEVLLGQRQLNLVRVQNYDTKLYWYHIDWYKPGYNSTLQPIAEVPNYSALDTLTLTAAPIGSSVKVTANAQGKFEIYLRTDLGWERVGLQDGTLQFSQEIWDYAAGNFGFDVEVFDAQYFDQEPVIETRKIIQAINEELFIDDLAIERNNLLILMFEFVYSEFTAPNWLIKTSLVDVDHKIRALLPFQTYLQDNQNFVLDYIQEVKPYHVQIREFNLSYFGEDTYPGEITDFDVPAYWAGQLELPQYISPVLTPYTRSDSAVENFVSDAAPDAEVWTLTPWNQWYNNYLLSIQGVTVVRGGRGYTVAPTVIVTGECVEQAEMEAIINSAGQVVSITVVNPGGGYKTAATITFEGGNGTGAVAVAQMGNDLVRSFTTTIKYDRCQYQTTIVDWEPNVLYDNGTQVRYLNRVWLANSDDSSGVEGPTFNVTEWVLVDAGSLSGVDRTMGFYTPTVNQPGLSLPLLIDGIDYPGVQVKGVDFNQNTGFDVGNYDINPFDNISYGPEGLPTYDPAILDAIYQSNYLDPYLGILPAPAYDGAPPNLPNALVVDGGAYVDTYESHAPEELVPGIEFDTLDLKVFTRPGSDWEFDGHGFPTKFKNFIYDLVNPTFSFADALPYPVEVLISNQSTGNDLELGVNYTVNWPAQTITVLSGANSGDILTVTVYELGGGNQLFKQTYLGNVVGNTINVPVEFSEIQEFAIFVNSVYLPQQQNDSTENYTFVSSGANQTQITFTTTWTSNDFISLIAIGPTTLSNGDVVDYSWSTPQTQIIIADGVSTAFDLDNSLSYTNRDNLIVTVNGVRARTSAGIEWYGDGSTEYLLPDRLGFSQALIADNEVDVYLNDIPQILGVDYTVEPYTGNARRVVFAQEPSIGTRILICVSTNTQCYINDGQLVFRPGAGIVPVLGDVIAVTTWNDTRQQNILTQVFVGPVTQGVTITEGYDEIGVPFDSGNVTGEPGSYDFSTGATVTVNNLDLGRLVTEPNRLWVTLDSNGSGGKRLFYGVDFTISGQELILTSGILGTIDVVMITQFAESVVPEAMAFRIFQDMRGVQATYRMTPSSTTTLAQPLSQLADIVYLTDASALGDPELDLNIWGILMVNGERIMYRYRDTTNNTVSGLLRGTAGTAASQHAVDSIVYDMGRGNLLPEQYQNYIDSNSFIADGTTTSFTADDVDLLSLDSTSIEEAVEVYVGGTRITTGYTIVADNPVTVIFDTAPPAGIEVTILVRHGVTWYAPGAGTPSDGVALQDTNTLAARFLRGEI